MALSVTVSICTTLCLDRSTVLREVAQPCIHRLDLGFEIGNGLSDVPPGCAWLTSIPTFALAQHADRDCHASHATLEAVTLEHRAQGVAGRRRCSAHA
jgi:hypothetical protein